MPTLKPLTLGLVQMAMQPDANANIAKAIAEITTAAKRGAQIICLPELFKTPYFAQAPKDQAAFDSADLIPGPVTDIFCALAKKLKVVIIVPLFEQTKGGKFFNTAAVIDETGKLLAPYRKVHIPQDPCFYEKNYFTPGDRGYQVYKTKHATFAVLICFDQWYPEAARSCVLAGADLIFYPTAIGTIAGYTDPDKEWDWRDSWETVQRGHAIANGIHVAAVNRVGREGKMTFWGNSFVADSFGKVLKRGSTKKVDLLLVKVTLGKNKWIQEGWGFLKNRRPETYGKLVKK